MLSLESIRAGYGTAPVLHDVSVVVPPGSIVALLGPNGAGKTSLLKVASGLLSPWAGAIRMDGTDITRDSAHQKARRGIGLVPEGRGIFRRLTVRENLALQAGSTSRSDAEELAVSAFPRLGERMDQVAGTLSGGEQQMLALARTYVSRPQIALLDEVSLGLAPKIVDEIFVFLRRLAEEGASMLLVEQYVAKALSMADFVYVLQRGRIVFAGEPGELDAEHVQRAYLGEGELAAH
jgi:branched-chain amino acid transport system ATP-binding protein